MSLIVIAMLAVGIGSTTGMFSVFDRVLLEPLHVPAPQELVNLGAPGPKWGSTGCGIAGNCDYVFSYPMFRDLEEQQTVFTGIAGHKAFQANLAYDHRASTGAGLLVSGSYFDVLGLRPALGRLIGRQDEPKIGESAVVVLSYDYWNSYFGADPSVVDRAMTVNGQLVTIIGVAPQGFAGTTIGYRPRVYVPLTMRWLMEPTAQQGGGNERTSYWLYLFARRKPGVTIEGAKAALAGIYHGILNDVEAPLNSFMPADVLARFRERQLTIEPGARGQSSLPEQATKPTSLLFGVTALVLLLVCANIANLLLARGAARAGEMAIRASLGAGRGHLLRQSLLEATVLAVLGGVVSIPVALATLRGMTALLPDGAYLDMPLSGTALLFAATAAIATVALFGLAPAITASRVDPGLVMKGQAQQAVGGRGTRRFRGLLATTQIVLSTTLLVLAGLFALSLANLARVDLGMNTTSIMTFGVSPRRNGYSPAEATRFYDRLEAELAAQPGVLGAASSMVPLLSGSNWASSMEIEGIDLGPPGSDNNSSMNSVSSGFFRTLGIPLIAGRDFTSADTADGPKVAIVNEAFVRKFKLGNDALDKRIGQEQPDMEIVGVVADAKYSEVKDAVPPQFFVPRQQNAFLDEMTFYVRAAVPPETLVTLVPRIVASIDPDVPVHDATTMRAVIDDNVYVERMVATLSTGFALLATVLAAVGLYGVLAYFVAQRTREIGLRSALGASAAQLRGMVLKQVAMMAGFGIPIGLAAAIAVGRAAESLLYGLRGYDPVVLGAAAVVLALVLLLAAYIPARRAAGIAPMEALRSD
jgi:putative ABC transport system permease protein